jgi:hypothetical protein
MIRSREESSPYQFGRAAELKVKLHAHRLEPDRGGIEDVARNEGEFLPYVIEDLIWYT